MGTNAHYLDLVRVNTPTIGTGGSLTIGAAVTGCLDFITGGAVDGTLYRYSILDGVASSEIGLATYNAGLGALTGRTVTKSTNNNNPLNLSGTAQILICLAAEDTNITLGSSVMSLGGSYGTIGGPISWSGLQTLAGGYTLPTIPLNSVLYSGGSGASVSGTLNSLGTIKFLTQINGSGPIWSDLPGTFAGFANPTGSIGLSAVNGTSAFAMRADGHPPIDQGIIPVWTGLHTFNAGLNATFGSFSGSVTGANFNGISGFANPTGSIGLTAVNGTSAFATRVDSHSGIDQSITPIWTGQHKWSVLDNNIAILATGSTKGIRIVPTSISTNIEGVDATGGGSYQPITVGGSVVNLSLFGSIVAIMNTTGFVPAITNTYSLGSPSLVWANVYATTGSFTNIITPGGSFSGLANPTGSIGLSAVNGTSAFATRADGHPALSQAIAPVWTNSHTWVNVATIGWQNSTGSFVGGSVGSQIFKFSDNNLYLDSYDIGSNFVFRGNLDNIYLIMGSATQAAFSLLVSSSGPNAGLQFQDRAGGTAVSWEWYSQSGVGRLFNNIGGDSIWVSTGGSVSIGAATPIAQFNVTGQGQGTTSNFNTTGSLGSVIFLNDTGALVGNGGAVLFGAGSGAWRFAAIKGFVTDGSSNSSGDLVFSTRFINSDSVLTEAFVIKGANGTATAGAVGIGTTAPLSRLDVGGGVAIGSYAGVNQAPANGLIVSGPAGIGTSSPLAGSGNLTVSSLIVVPVIVGGTSINSALDLRTTSNGTASGDIFAIRGSEIAFTTIPGTIYGIMTVTGLYLGNGTPINRLDVSGGAAIGSYAGTLAPTNGLIVSGSVGLGTSAPDSVFTISANSINQQVTGTLPGGTTLHLLANNASVGRFTIDTFGGNAAFTGRRANGSLGGTLGALNAGDVIMTFAAFGHDGSGYGINPQANIQFSASNNWSPTDHSTYFAFLTTGPGATTQTERMRICASGGINVGGTTDPGSSGYLFANTQLSVGGSPSVPLFTADNAGRIIAYGGFHQLGTASNLNTNIIIQSGTGGGAGAGVFIQNGAGNNVMAFGNYSAIFGGVYNSTAVVYSSGPMLFQGSSFSFQAGPITLGSYITPGTLGVTTGSGVVIAGGFVTPQMFGCVGDGITDDTINLQNCLNSNKPVLLIGKFKITGPININTVGGTISSCVYGAGMGQSLILLSGTGTVINVNVTYSVKGIPNPQLVWKDITIVPTTPAIGLLNGSSPSLYAGLPIVGALNLIGTSTSGTGAGSVMSTAYLENVNIQPDNCDVNYSLAGIILKDMRSITLTSCNINGFTNGGKYNVGSGIVWWASQINSAPISLAITNPNIYFFNIGVEVRPFAGGTIGTANDAEGLIIQGGSIVACNVGLNLTTVDYTSAWAVISGVDFNTQLGGILSANWWWIEVTNCLFLMSNFGNLGTAAGHYTTTYGISIAVDGSGHIPQGQGDNKVSHCIVQCQYGTVAGVTVNGISMVNGAQSAGNSRDLCCGNTARTALANSGFSAFATTQSALTTGTFYGNTAI